MTDDEIIQVLAANGVQFQRFNAPHGPAHLTLGCVQADVLVKAVRAVMCSHDREASTALTVPVIHPQLGST